MDSELLLSTVAIFCLLVLSAFFSGSETALTAASRPRMHTLAQQGDHRAELVNRLWDIRERLIGAILLGNNLVNILASALATSVLIGLVGDAGVVYATLGMTCLVLIFAEVLPKTYALYHADRLALTAAPVIRVVVVAFGPFVQTVEAIVTASLRLFGAHISSGHGSEAYEEALRGAIDMHAATGEEERHEREMMRSILELADIEVGEIMSHRKNVVAIDIDQPPSKIIEEVVRSPYTRLPVWKNDPDNIVGVLHAKALLREVVSNPTDLDSLDILSIAGAPWFIPESTDLLSQLQAFRARHEHFAIVVDEYGALLGIVTLEDILEEIVGDISDEHDLEIEGVQVRRDGSVLVDGEVTIRDLNRRFDWRLPDEEASTVAGLVLHEARRIPDIGQAFVFHDFRFQILGRQRNQITRLKITPLAAASKAEPRADSA